MQQEALHCTALVPQNNVEMMYKSRIYCQTTIISENQSGVPIEHCQKLLIS